MIVDDQQLSGGVSSDIRIRQTDDGPIVVKRALAKLKVSADWRASPERSNIEVRALRAAAVLIGKSHVPAVLWEDRPRHMFAMTLADPALKNWKQELLAGIVDMETAAAVGDTLGLLHLRSSGNTEIEHEFRDLSCFDELRLDPFFHRVAQKFPQFEVSIEAVVNTMSQRRSVLVHGDFSPKNLLVRGNRVVVLDFEVAHWGDPAFDLAFCSAHLLLKGWRRAAHEGTYIRALGTFLKSYAARFGREPIDNHLIRMTACLLLARTDGDSPIDYGSDLDIVFVRRAAAGLLDASTSNLLDAVTQFRRAV